MRFSIVLIIAALLTSAAGGVFVLSLKKEVAIKLIEEGPRELPEIRFIEKTIEKEEIEIKKELEGEAEEVFIRAEELISQAKEFLEEEKENKALIKKAKEKASQARGIYVGRGQNPEYFKTLLADTELNSLVIDVKEYYRTNLPLSLKKLIEELHQEDIWIIARVVVFHDSSLISEKPDWYLATTSTATSSVPWQDAVGQYWLDPGSEEVQNYIVEFSREVIDFGFDELQFDYIRYPNDYQRGEEDRIKVIGDFFGKLSEELKSYKLDIMLSADLFGYIATQYNSYDIGQGLVNAGEHFDYLSFMLYPSHFYGGFYYDEIGYSYPEVVERPYEVVYYSIVSAANYLSLFDYQAGLRPWLQDFDLAVDSQRDILYDAEKVRAQITAAQNATSSGWLLWNPSYIYTAEALEQSREVDKPIE